MVSPWRLRVADRGVDEATPIGGGLVACSYFVPLLA